MFIKSPIARAGFILGLTLILSLMFLSTSNRWWEVVAAPGVASSVRGQDINPTAPHAGTIVIDNFETSQAVLSLDSPGDVGKTKSSFVSGPGILGSERDMSATLIKGGVGTNGVDVQIAGGVYSYSQDPTVEAQSEVQWDGVDGSMALNPTGLGSQDLTNSKAKDALRVQLVFDDLPVDLQLTVYTDGLNASRYALTVPGGIFAPIDLVVPYSLFSPTMGAGADFTSVGATTLSIRAASAPDLVVDLVTSISRLTATKRDSLVLDTNGDGVVNPGDTVRYTVVVENSGDFNGLPVDDAVFCSGVNPNSTLVVGSVTTTQGAVTKGNTTGDNSVCVTLGTVNDGKNVIITFDVLIKDPLPVAIESIACQGQVTYEGIYKILTDDPDTPEPDDPTVTPVVAAPDFSLTKSDGGVTAIPGQAIVYTITYNNVGNQDAVGVVLRETVPANTTFNAGASTAGWVCTPNANAGSQCTLNIGAMAGRTSSGTARFAATVINPMPAGVSQISNRACIEDDGSNGPDPTPANNCGDDSAPLIAQPDLRMTKDANSASIQPGGALVYTLTYANVGNQGATGVTLNETVPANTVFNAAASSPGWACSPNGNAGSACTLAVGTLAGGATGTARFAVDVVDPMPAGVNLIGNRACIRDDAANGADPTPANNCDDQDTVVDAEPDLRLTKDDGGVTVQPGGVIVYTLAYINAGNQNATGVTISETVPAHTVFEPAASTAGWNCAPNGNAGGKCTLNIGSVAAGANGVALFALRVVDPLPSGLAQIANVACAADDGANGTDPTPDDNCDEDTTPVDGRPDLRVSKDDRGLNVEPGGLIVYTITYANVGNQDATGVTLRETVPTYTTFEAASSSAGWVCTPNANAGSACSLSVGLVRGGTEGIVLFAVRVTMPRPPGVTQIVNRVCLDDDGANGPDPSPSNNCDEEDTDMPIPTPTPTATPNRHYFPMILRPLPTPTPTRTPTPTPTATPTPRPITEPTVIPIPNLYHPKGIAVNPKTNRIYVASRDNDSLMVVDGNASKYLTRIHVCDEPFGVAVNSMTNKIYVACFASGDVQVIDGAANQVKSTIDVGPEPTYLAINEKTNRVYVPTHGNNGLVGINGATDSVFSIRGLDAGVFGVAVNENLDQVYVTSRDQGVVAVLDGDTHILNTFAPGDDRDSPFAVGFNPKTNKLYVTYTVNGYVERLAVYRSSAAGLVREATVTLPTGGKDAPGDVGIDTATNHIIVANSASHSLSVINGFNNTIITNVPIPGDPFGMAVNSITRRIYIGARASDKLWVVPDNY